MILSIGYVISSSMVIQYQNSIKLLSLELVVWLVPNIIIAAIAVSFVGFFLGPMYPIIMNETGRLLPPWLLTGSIGWIASFGFSGMFDDVCSCTFSIPLTAILNVFLPLRFK